MLIYSCGVWTAYSQLSLSSPICPIFNALTWALSVGTLKCRAYTSSQAGQCCPPSNIRYVAVSCIFRKNEICTYVTKLIHSMYFPHSRNVLEMHTSHAKNKWNLQLLSHMGNRIRSYTFNTTLHPVRLLFFFFYFIFLSKLLHWLLILVLNLPTSVRLPIGCIWTESAESCYRSQVHDLFIQLCNHFSMQIF